MDDEHRELNRLKDLMKYLGQTEPGSVERELIKLIIDERSLLQNSEDVKGVEENPFVYPH